MVMQECNCELSDLLMMFNLQFYDPTINAQTGWMAAGICPDCGLVCEFSSTRERGQVMERYRFSDYMALLTELMDRMGRGLEEMRKAGITE